MKDIDKKALLVSLKIKKWSLSKKAVQAAQEGAKAVGAKEGSISSNKNLLGGKDNNSYFDKIDNIRIAGQEAGDFFREQTLPWSNEGQRILLNRNRINFDSGMRKHEGKFQQAVKDYLNVHNSAITEAKQYLGSEYNQDDFPADIASKYSWAVEYVPVPVGNDFRIELAEEEMKEMQENLDNRNAQLANDAMKEAYGKLEKEVGLIADYFEREKAAQAAGKKTRFHDSLVENLNNVLSIIPDINLTDSQELKELAKEAKKELAELSSEKIKEMKPAEKESKKKAAKKIAENCAGFMGEVAA